MGTVCPGALLPDDCGCRACGCKSLHVFAFQGRLGGNRGKSQAWGGGHDLLGENLNSCMSVPLRGKEEKYRVRMPKLRMPKEYKDKRKSIDDLERS